MSDSYRIQQLENDLESLKGDNKRLEEQVQSLASQVKVFVDERNQLIGMGKLARFGVKALLAMGAYGLIRAIHDIGQWFNSPWKAAH